MVIKYFKDLTKRFLNLSLFKKLLIILFILFDAFLLVISFVKTDYQIICPGFLNEASEVIKVDTSNERGHILTVSVTQHRNVSISQYWRALKEKKLAVEKIEKDDLTAKEENVSGIIAKRVAINNAIICAYNEAKKINNDVNLVYTYKGLIIAYLSKSIETELNVDDIIYKIDDVEFHNRLEFNNIYDEILGIDKKGGTKTENDIIKFSVLRYNKKENKYYQYEKYSKIYRNESDQLALGFSVYDYYELDPLNSNPQFEIDYNENYDSKGGSGGAMMALSLYNALIEEDISKNLIIAGTGTIDILGNVGVIASVKQKIIRAYTSQVDVFYVAKDNYEEAKEVCIELGYDLNKLVCAATLKDILNDLKGRKAYE